MLLHPESRPWPWPRPYVPSSPASPLVRRLGDASHFGESPGKPCPLHPGMAEHKSKCPGLRSGCAPSSAAVGPPESKLPNINQLRRLLKSHTRTKTYTRQPKSRSPALSTSIDSAASDRNAFSAASADKNKALAPCRAVPDPSDPLTIVMPST